MQCEIEKQQQHRCNGTKKKFGRKKMWQSSNSAGLLDCEVKNTKYMEWTPNGPVDRHLCWTVQV